MTHLRALTPKEALELAVAKLEEIMPPHDPQDPRQSHEYVKLKQKHRMAVAARRAAESVEFSARMATHVARKLETEIQVELELLEERLGIAKEEDQS